MTDRRPMKFDNHAASEVLNALAHPTRLAVFRELMAYGPDGAAAGTLGRAVDLAPNALSFHLNRLKQAGMVSTQRAGQHTFYRADLPVMQALVAFLDSTCCREVVGGCGDQCPPQPQTIANKEHNEL
ncbi:ArsR/SmtB family transcription factor [Marinobacter gelidimuriae]|uniref:ArsR/SmtB family transcription factor n=1 Tax=Marinobacter gelidimuriae TaxID=2739064 RepID=UPI000363394A|nr:metalloregulator ArsR/SmtB family transcription factor [Marinobacter gelidimuriae]